MVSSQFGGLLKVFETFFKCPLEPDENNSCLIHLGIGISIQIEMEKYGFILVGSKLGSVHMGRYRDNLIKQALKSNASSFPSCGIFGFSQKSNQLILFIKIDPIKLSPHEIVNSLPPFINKAKIWKEAIEKGDIPALDRDSPVSDKPSGIFGLIS